MKDDSKKVWELRERIMEFQKERDWEKFHNPKDVAISLSLEAAELLEIFQWEGHRKSEDVKTDEKSMERIREELAEVIIYAF